jgi:hypothetical protein
MVRHRPTRLGVAVLLAAARVRASELDLGAEALPAPDPAARCAAWLASASPQAPEVPRAWLLAAPGPFPAPPENALTDAELGRLDCRDTAEPDLPLSAVADAGGRLALDVPDELDAGCWDVALARGCAVRRIPLHALRPEREPGRFSAWLETGPVRARRAVQTKAAGALRVLDATPLGGLGGTLVRLAPEDGADGAQVAAALADLEAQPEMRHRVLVSRGNAGSEGDWGIRSIGIARLRPPQRPPAIRVALVAGAIAPAPGWLAPRIALARDFTGRAAPASASGPALAGIAAAAPGAALLALSACADEPGGAAARCWTSALVRALDAAVEEKARIALLAWSGPDDALVARALERAEKRGVLLVAPAGEPGDEESPRFPASHPAVIAVTALDRAGAVYSPAARGAPVQLAAPGVDLQASGSLEQDAGPLSGSALAAAHVASAAAALLARAPRTTAAALREALTSTAVDLGPPGRDPVFGFGRIDVCAAARALSGPGASGEEPCTPEP